MADRKPKIKDNISPLDAVFLISIVVSIIMSILALALEPGFRYANSSQSDRARGGTALAVIAMLLLFAMLIMEIIVFFTCRNRYKGFLIGLITLGCFSTVLFIIGAALNYDRTPHFGAWLIAACCLSFISSIITVIDHCTQTVEV